MITLGQRKSILRRLQMEWMDLITHRPFVMDDKAKLDRLDRRLGSVNAKTRLNKILYDREESAMISRWAALDV